MSRWLQVNTGDMHLPEEKFPVKGVEIQMGISRFDIPTDVRGGPNDQEGKFVIELQYLDKENTQSQKLSDFLTVEHGKNSGRIFKIIIDIKNHEINLVKFELLKPKVSSALEELKKWSSKRETQINSSDRSKDNINIVSQIIAKKESQLLKGISASQR